MILTYSSTISKTILGNEGWKSSGKYREEFLSMEEIFSVQTPRGTEREGGWGQEKEAVPAGTRNWGHRDGPWAQAAHQEDAVRRKRSILQEEEEGLLSRLSDSASRFRDPTGGGSGCVEGSMGQGDSGNRRGGWRAWCSRWLPRWYSVSVWSRILDLHVLSLLTVLLTGCNILEDTVQDIETYSVQYPVEKSSLWSFFCAVFHNSLQLYFWPSEFSVN